MRQTLLFPRIFPALSRRECADPWIFACRLLPAFTYVFLMLSILAFLVFPARPIIIMPVPVHVIMGGRPVRSRDIIPFIHGSIYRFHRLLKGYVYGNIREEMAEKIAEKVAAMLKSN